MTRNATFEYIHCPIVSYKPILDIPKRLGIHDVDSVKISHPSTILRSTISSPRNLVFSGIRALHLDNFGFNSIINDQPFQGAEDLQSLVISNSAIEIAEDFFNNLQGLKELRIIRNDVVHFDHKAIRNLRNLTSLVLEAKDPDEIVDNRLILMDDAFKNLVNIKKMRLSGLGLGTFSSSLFRNLDALTELDLASNGIRILPNWSGLSNNGLLRRIDLSGNELSGIPK